MVQRFVRKRRGKQGCNGLSGPWTSHEQGLECFGKVSKNHVLANHVTVQVGSQRSILFRDGVQNQGLLVTEDMDQSQGFPLDAGDKSLASLPAGQAGDIGRAEGVKKCCPVRA